MIYAIWALEHIYGGLHGIEDFRVEDCSLDEACEFGYEMSTSLIEEYSIGEMREDCTSEELEEFILDNIEYIIFEVIDTHGKTLRELEREFTDDPDGFVSDFCKRVDI